MDTALVHYLTAGRFRERFLLAPASLTRYSTLRWQEAFSSRTTTLEPSMRSRPGPFQIIHHVADRQRFRRIRSYIRVCLRNILSKMAAPYPVRTRYLYRQAVKPAS